MADVNKNFNITSPEPSSSASYDFICQILPPVFIKWTGSAIQSLLDVDKRTEVGYSQTSQTSRDLPPPQFPPTHVQPKRYTYDTERRQPLHDPRYDYKHNEPPGEQYYSNVYRNQPAGRDYAYEQSQNQRASLAAGKPMSHLQIDGYDIPSAYHGNSTYSRPVAGYYYRQHGELASSGYTRMYVPSEIWQELHQ